MLSARLGTPQDRDERDQCHKRHEGNQYSHQRNLCPARSLKNPALDTPTPERDPDPGDGEKEAGASCVERVHTARFGCLLAMLSRFDLVSSWRLAWDGPIR